MELFEESIAALVREGRARAWEKVDEIMQSTYLEIAALMRDDVRTTGAVPRFRGGVEGVSAIMLNEIADNCLDDSALREKLHDPNLHKRRSEFLGVRKMAIDNVKIRYPRAFEPWTVEEDNRLLSMSASGMPLKDMSALLQRNTHAISLRLDHISK